eukprot:TRINITY_DN10044_c0_g1_i2.p1 TRINITY_DN10044_c0_g1~~TRINITY_DN10044_c0_g1_i2.p1  ORF type:complete len:137 (+),score=44.56 TRINITY_DN10044_c0_g1_i2:148-558(+)
MLTDFKNWDPEKSVVITCSFAAGSISMTAFKITPPGFEWGKNRESGNFGGFSPAYYDKAQLLLSDFFMGFFLVPETGSWNYNLFAGVRYSPTMKYNLKLENPKDFYHETHRPNHFLNFAQQDEKNETAVDREDLFA